MQEIQDRAKAYSFELQANQSVGVLRIGWKRFNVSVTHESSTETNYANLCDSK